MANTEYDTLTLPITRLNAQSKAVLEKLNVHPFDNVEITEIHRQGLPIGTFTLFHTSGITVIIDISANGSESTKANLIELERNLEFAVKARGISTLKSTMLSPNSSLHQILSDQKFLVSSHIMFLSFAKVRAIPKRTSMTVRAMSEAEFSTYKSESIEKYRIDLVQSRRSSEEESHQDSVDSFDRLLPQGLNSLDTYLCIGEHEGRQVGILWVAVNTGADKKESFIYDIEVIETARGKGFGEDLMKFAREIAESENCDRIGLNVFGYNVVAKNLYLKLGFQVVVESLYKELK